MSSSQITRDSTAQNTYAVRKERTNGFIVFRSCLLQEGRVPPKINVSVYAAQEWHKLSPQEKNRYTELARFKNKHGFQPRDPKRRARSKAKSVTYSSNRDSRPEIRNLDSSATIEFQIPNYSQQAGPSNISSLPHYPVQNFVNNANNIPNDEPSGSSSAQVFLPAPQPVRPFPSWVYEGAAWAHDGPYYGIEHPLRTREPSPQPPQSNQIQNIPDDVIIEDTGFESFSGSYPFPEVPYPEGLFDDTGEAWAFSF